jgi:hypothetical protein
MGQAKARKEQIDAIKASGIRTKLGSPFTHTTEHGNMGLGFFDLNAEIAKTVVQVIDDPRDHATAMNKQDWLDMQPLFRDSAGFFFIIQQVHGIGPNGQGYQVGCNTNYTPEQLMKFCSQFKRTTFSHKGKDYLVLSTFCTPDMVWDKFAEAKHKLCCVSITYSTPKQHQILGENL